MYPKYAYIHTLFHLHYPIPDGNNLQEPALAPSLSMYYLLILSISKIQ